MAVLVSELEVSKEIEGEFLDLVQGIRRHFSTDIKPAEEVVFIGIDDKTCDPLSFPPYSEQFGEGGWQTRELWTFPMQFCRQFFQPRVLAYDILLPHSKPIDAVPESPLLAPLHGANSRIARNQIAEIESQGNDEIQVQLINLAELPDPGVPPTKAVFAFEFASNPLKIARLIEQGGRLDFLKNHEIHADCIRSPHALPVYNAASPLLTQLIASPVSLGSVNDLAKTGSTIRRMPLILAHQDPRQPGEIHYTPSFALQSILAFRGIDPTALRPLPEGNPGLEVVPGKYLRIRDGDWERTAPIDAEGNLLLNGRFHFLDFRGISYIYLVKQGILLAEGKADSLTLELQKALKGKIAVVGTSYTGGPDLGNFPLNRNTAKAFAHLLIIDNFLRNDFLRPANRTETSLLFAGISLLAFVTTQSKLRRSSLLFLLPVLILLGLWLSFQLGSLVFPALASMTLCGGLLGLNSYLAYRTEAAQREQVRKLFSAAVSPNVLEMMEHSKDPNLLQGMRRDVTIFFSDLAGFTSIAESMEPQVLHALLRRYFEPMTDIVLAHDGYLDKFIGDAILAVWGCLIPQSDHAVRACRAALAQAAALEPLAETIFKETGTRLGVRMGINSGTVSAGIVGTNSKFQFTVLGDAVNFAARLEPANKDYGTQITIGHETRRQAGDQIVARLLDKIIVKGKTEPVEIHELIALSVPGQPIPDWVSMYEKGLRLMWSQKWNEALEAFDETIRLHNGKDGPSETMKYRIAEYQKNPPPSDWQGAYVRKAKD